MKTETTYNCSKASLAHALVTKFPEIDSIVNITSDPTRGEIEIKIKKKEGQFTSEEIEKITKYAERYLVRVAYKVTICNYEKAKNEEKQKNNDEVFMPASSWLLPTILCSLILILLKLFGVVSVSWITALSSVVWLPALVLVLAVVACLMLVLAANIKRKIRKWKTDRRIIRQAKANGCWDSGFFLGGRALELKVWEDFKLWRLPGESDAQLRHRYMAKCSEVHGNTPSQGGTDNERI